VAGIETVKDLEKVVSEIVKPMVDSQRYLGAVLAYQHSSRQGALSLRQYEPYRPTIVGSMNVGGRQVLPPIKGPYEAGSIIGITPVEGPGTITIPETAEIDVIRSEEYQVLKQQLMMAPAIKEYLRALELRFVPFRRYHLFSSHNNLVWNGIMSSENAVVNGVDVTYFNWNEKIAEANSPAATVLVKAHSTIPDYKLRIAPIRYSNCKGYTMALRYGIGEVLHRVKDMYRGEIIITGNPRVRPWDIGILTDSYNDMTGPVEVEQVVHTFSHETGFITEVKPSAVAIANEMSSWPVLEAMKTFALAVRDIEDSYLGIRGSLGQTGFLHGVADLGIGYGGDKLDNFYMRKYQKLFGETGANSVDIFTTGIPNTDGIDEAIDGVYDRSRLGLYTGVGLLTGVAVGSAAGALSYTGALSILAKAGGKSLSLKNLYSGSSALGAASAIAIPAAGTGVAGGLIGSNAANTIDAWSHLDEALPSVVWLVAGPILMLKAMKSDAVMVVPLVKNGNPIISGFTYQDPTLIWKNFKGDLRMFAHDTLTGTQDMLDLYRSYGRSIWRNWDETSMTGGL
jgi:hypothetical protein